MDSYISNITNLNKAGNNISFTHEDIQYYLLITIPGESITLQLKEENSVINYIGTMLFPEITKEKLFNHCEAIDEVKDIMEQVISEGQIILQVNKDNTYNLTLFNKPYSKYLNADVLLKEEEVFDKESFLHRVDEQLKALPISRNIDDFNRLYYNIVNKLIKPNNIDKSALKEELNLLFKEHSKSRLKAKEENILKAVNEFDNYILQIDSLDSFINKMRLYKDVLMNLEDDKIGKRLKDGFCSLYNIISGEFCSSYKKLKEKLTEQEAKEEQLSQILKELKDEILKQNSKEEYLSQIIKKLTKETLKQNSKEDHLSQTIKELRDKILKQNSKKEYLSQTVKELKNKLLKQKILFSEEKLKAIKTDVIIGEHKDSITAMISLSFDIIATASSDNTIKIWDLNKNLLIKTLEGHTSFIYCLALLSDGNIASGSGDKSIKIWDGENDYKYINALNGHTDGVKCLLVLKNGNLISRSWDKCIRVWDYKSYKCIKTIEDHTRYGVSLINLIDGFYASGYEDNTIKIWNTNNECVNTIKDDNSVFSLLLLPENNIASGSYQTIKIWKCDIDYKNIQYIYTIKGHTNYIYTLYLVNDDYILSGSGDKTIKVWDLKNGYQCINTLTGHNNRISSLLILNNDRLISTSQDGTVRLWN
jgi:WD40 repeat protein